MIKNLLLSTMLMVSTPLNANITQITQQTANFNTVDRWTNEADEGIIESYRTKEAKTITNGSMLIKQRAIEKYVGDSTTSTEKYTSNFYIVINYENRAVSLDNLLLNIEGLLYTQYPVQNYAVIYKAFTDLEQDQNIEDFLNNETYDTYQEYFDIEQKLRNLLLNGSTNITPQYYEDLQNISLQLTPNTTTNIGLIFRIQIIYDDDLPLPDSEPLNNQYNYPKQIIYDITFTADSTNANEIVDIPGLMFTILGMPFAWLSQAFNLTIFPGTPYALNLSHIFIVIVASLILIVIIKKLLH